MTSRSTCASCSAERAVNRTIRDGLTYAICGRCGHCELELATDIPTEFERAQVLYHGADSAELAKGVAIFKNEVLQHRTRAIGAYVAPPAKVVEIGPGDGSVLAWLHAIGCRPTAIEHSPHIAEHLRTTTAANVIEGDFDTLQIEPDRFDAGCSFHVIEHVCDPAAHLRNALRIVKPGGRFFLATPNARSWQHAAPGLLSPNFDSAHFRLFTKASLGKLCRETGWEVERKTTPEFSTGWLRVATKVMRRIRGQDEESTAGQYSSEISPRTEYILRSYRALATPLLRVQAALGGGNELFFVLRKPATT